MNCQRANDLIKFLEDFSFSINSPGYSIEEVDKFITSICNRLKNESFDNYPIIINVPNFSSGNMRYIGFILPSFGLKGYNQDEVNELFQIIRNNYSDIVILE